MSSSSDSGIIRLVDKGLAVIIGLISNFVFDIINVKPNRLELGIIVILVFLLWAALHQYLINWIKNLRILKNNQVWRDVLLGIMDFILLLGIFLILQLVLEFLQISIGSSDPNLFEIFLGIFTFLLLTFSIVHRVKSLT